MIGLCGSCGAGSGAGTGLIGKEAALYTIHDHCADSAGHCLAQSKGL